MSTLDFEIVAGLEIHAELATKSKIFCYCKTDFEGEPNTYCCPLCIGMPGTLPSLNKKAVELAVKAGLALNCDIRQISRFDRKNYFYPDLPKSYQITQFYEPICTGGWVDLAEAKGGEEVSEKTGKDGKTWIIGGEGNKSSGKKIRIKEIHLEEDAGKLFHSENFDETLIDFNRSGIPLIEIVTMPDVRSGEEALIFLEKLKAILKCTGVSDCRMEEGSLRVDVNLSVRPAGSESLGNRTEIKNLNSFRAVVRAIEWEAARQIREINKGKEIRQVTLRWDEREGTAVVMRNKENSNDYRYFPEPDIPPVVLSCELIQYLKSKIPELPDARKKRYINDYGLPPYDASVITGSEILSALFEDAVKAGAPAKKASNWIMGELLRLLNESGQEAEQTALKFNGTMLEGLIKAETEGRISTASAKTVLKIMFETGRHPEDIIAEEGLEMISDMNRIQNTVKMVLDNNQKGLEDYKKGKTKVSRFFFGQVMKELKGLASPEVVWDVLNDKLSNMK